MPAKPTVDAFMAECLVRAYEQYPDCGFLLHIVDDAKHGELTCLSNMDQDEIDEVLSTVDDNPDAPFVPLDASTRFH